MAELADKVGLPFYAKNPANILTGVVLPEGVDGAGAETGQPPRMAPSCSTDGIDPATKPSRSPARP